MKISVEDAEMLAQKFAEKMQQARSVSDSEHFDHHKWITEKIQTEKAMREFWQALAGHVAKWGAISLVSVVGYALWLAIKQAVKTA